MTKIRDLEPGTTFRYPELGITAVLTGLGQMGARVSFDGAPPVIVTDYSDVEVVNT
jgi:hypothetical protein